MAMFITCNGNFPTSVTSSQKTASNNYMKPCTILKYNTPTKVWKYICLALDTSWN